VKKLTLILVAVGVAAAVLAVTTVTVVNMKGGVSAEHQGISKLPLVGKLMRVNMPNPDELAGTGLGPLANDRPLPFVRPGDDAKLAVLVRDLEKKSAEYDDMVFQLRRRSQELEAWERQLATERDLLKQRVEQQVTELNQREILVSQKEAELQARTVVITEAESANLRKAADIYAKMDAEKAADVLSEVYMKDKDGVIKIISLMDERSAAKALAAMKDPRLSAEITGKLTHIITVPAGETAPVMTQAAMPASVPASPIIPAVPATAGSVGG